jgi:hypothetical protein
MRSSATESAIQTAASKKSTASQRGSSSLGIADPGDHIAQRLLWNVDPTDKITEEVRIGHVEQAIECGAFVRVGTRVSAVQVSQQQGIELAHAATAAPTETRRLLVGGGTVGGVRHRFAQC